MNSKNLFWRFGQWSGAALLSASLLTACGGGGGGDAGQPANPANPTINRAPVAAFTLSGMIHAGSGGSDASAVAGSQIALNASESKDADGDLMTYAWTLVSKPTTSNTMLTTTTGAQLSLTPDVAGDYVISVRVSDPKGAFSEKKATITITGNQAPVTNVAVTTSFAAVAQVMPSQPLTVGAAVVLDATGSTDADGDAVSVTWEITEKPSGSAALLMINNANARFSPDVQGVFKVRARGTDARGSYSETVHVFDANNRAPQTMLVSSASNPTQLDGEQTLNAATGYIVSLNGADSVDADGDQLTYAWTVVSQPAGSAAALDNVTGSTTQITPDLLGDYVVKMTVADAKGAQSSRLTTVKVNNRRPQAAITSNATPVALAQGPTVRLPVKTLVTLRANGSFDADGDTLTYSWSVLSKPTSSTAVLSATNTDTVQITPDVDGQYQLLMRVTDSAGAFSEQSFSLAIGNWAPVAVVDRDIVSDNLGATFAVSAARSYDDDYDRLTYKWEIDARPSGSTATIANSNSVKLSFVPDLVGTYVASVTVSDGRNSSVAYVTIRVSAVPSSSAFELAFKPGMTRYSRAVDKMISLAANPDSLFIVDPFTGGSKSIPLSGPGLSLTLSPDGKLAAVLQTSNLVLVDLTSGSVLYKTTLANSHTGVVINNAGLAYLLGAQNAAPAGPAIRVIDAKTGIDHTATLGSYESDFTASGAAILSPLNHRIYLYANNGLKRLKYVDLDAVTGKVLTSATFSTQNDGPGSFLFENEKILIQGDSAVRADSLIDLGRLANAFGPVDSVSNSTDLNETIVTNNGPRIRESGGIYVGYNNHLVRYTGELMAAAGNLSLPLVGGETSYAVFAAHSSNNRHVVLAQTMTSERNGIGARYYVVIR